MHLQDREVERWRRKFGMSRRHFVRTSAAMAIGFWAIDRVMPGDWGSYASAHNTKTLDACDLEWAGRGGLETLENLPGEFIFDIQSHHVDPTSDWRVTNPAIVAFFAALWPQSSPVLGAQPGVREDGSVRGGGAGEIDPIENLSRFHYVKELFLDSATTMTVLSCVPTSPDTNNPLPLAEAALTVHTVNDMSKSQRSIMHAFVMPNRGSAGMSQDQLVDPATAVTGVDGPMPLFFDDEMELMWERAEHYKDILGGWKTYCAWGDVPYASGWWLDSDYGMEFLKNVKAISDKYPEIPPVVATHKGFSLPGFDQRGASPRDVGPAAKANPGVRFMIYHSGYDIFNYNGVPVGGKPEGPYAGDANVDSSNRTVDSFIKSLRENNWDASKFIEPGKKFGNVPNVWAELGSVWRDQMSNPDGADAPAGQADHPRRPQADRVGHRQPLVRLAAEGDRGAAQAPVHRGGQAALQPALRPRRRRRRPDQAGARSRADDPQRHPRPQRGRGLQHRPRRAPQRDQVQPGQRAAALGLHQGLPRPAQGAGADGLQHGQRPADAARGPQGPHRGGVVAVSGRLARWAAAPALVALVLVAGPAPAAAAAGCAAPAAGGDWSFYGATFDNHREQLAERTISPANAAQLGVAWQRAMPDGGVIQSTPTVVDGCVFTGTDLGAVYALNADTGDVVWERKLQGGGGNFAVGAGIIGAPAVANGLVYVAATAQGKSLEAALDQATGAIVWSQLVDGDSGGGADSSPIPFEGMLFQAYQGDESSNHSNPGYAIMDASREGGGQVLAHGKVIPAADFAAGDRGGSIVDTPAYDPVAQAHVRRHGQPGQRARPRAHRRAAEDRRRPGLGDVRRDPRLAGRQARQLPGAPGRRLAGLPDGPAVAARALHVRAVRLQLPRLAEPVHPQRRAPAVRRAAEGGRLHHHRRGDDGAGLGGHARRALLRLQPELERRRRARGLRRRHRRQPLRPRPRHGRRCCGPSRRPGPSTTRD